MQNITTGRFHLAWLALRLLTTLADFFLRTAPLNNSSVIKVSACSLTSFFFFPPPLGDDGAPGSVNQENLGMAQIETRAPIRWGPIFSTSALTRNTRIELQETAHRGRWVSAISQKAPVRLHDGAFKDQPGGCRTFKCLDFFFVLGLAHSSARGGFGYLLSIPSPLPLSSRYKEQSSRYIYC